MVGPPALVVGKGIGIGAPGRIGVAAEDVGAEPPLDGEVVAAGIAELVDAIGAPIALTAVGDNAGRGEPGGGAGVTVAAAVEPIVALADPAEDPPAPCEEAHAAVARSITIAITTRVAKGIISLLKTPNKPGISP